MTRWHMNIEFYKRMIISLFIVVSWGCSTADMLVDRFIQDLKELRSGRKPLAEDTGKTLDIESMTCQPSRMKPGHELDVLVQYSVRPPKPLNTLQIREQWILKRNEKQIGILAEEVNDRERGTYQIGGKIVVPKRLAEGSYTVEHKLETCPPGENQNCLYAAQKCGFEVYK
ncbi:hypothetical protein [Desulfosoma sp.]